MRLPALPVTGEGLTMCACNARRGVPVNTRRSCLGEEHSGPYAKTAHAQMGPKLKHRLVFGSLAFREVKTPAVPKQVPMKSQSGSWLV